MHLARSASHGNTAPSCTQCGRIDCRGCYGCGCGVDAGSTTELSEEVRRPRHVRRRSPPRLIAIDPPRVLSSMPFVPVAVENPGGGRIRDKKAPGPAELMTVLGVGGKRVQLHRLAALAWQALITAAANAGLGAPLLLPTSGFRSPARQQQLWKAAVARYGSEAEARKWVAPPGGSPHQTGRAIDFYLGGRNSSQEVARLRTLPAYRWLLQNAARFGFFPYSAEPWHWEYNPGSGGAISRPAPAQPAPAQQLRKGVVRCPPPSNLSVPERTALALTSNFETGTPFGCVVSKPSDPDGISMGMIQWNLRARTLQGMVGTFEKRGGQLQPYFQDLLPDLRRLLAMPQTAKSDLEAMINEAHRLRLATPGRWETALLSLCSDPLFCQLQVEDLSRRLKVVWPAVRTLGLKTIRGLCVLFDVQVGDGLAARVSGRVVANGKVQRFAERLRKREATLGRALTEAERVLEIADEAALFAGKWAAERRARRMLIAVGSGRYRNSNWQIDKLFPNLNDALPATP